MSAISIMEITPTKTTETQTPSVISTMCMTSGMTSNEISFMFTTRKVSIQTTQHQVLTTLQILL